MSHRDKDCRTTSRTYAQELSGVLEGLLADIDWSGVQFRKDCRWSGRGLAMAALIWAWSARTTLKDRFEQSMKFMEPLSRRLAPASSSPQAFMKLLVRWTSELRQLLVGRFQRMMELQLAVEFLQENFVVFAGDGSKLQLARTRSNQARYSPAKSKKRKGKKRRARRPNSAKARAKRARQQKADSPQMALTLMYHVGLRLPWDWRLGPYDSSERDHLREMIPGLPANALVVADAGFVGYEFWSDLLASGRQFIIRAGGNVRLLKNLGVVRETQGLVYLWPDMAAKRRQPPLQLRLVVVHDGRQPWYLVTSVRDPRRLSDRQVAQIYRRRWRIELFFRHFKQTYGRAKLRSHKAEHAECEAEWSLLGLWAMLLHRQIQPAGKEEIAAEQTSVAKVIRAFGQAIDESKCRPQRNRSLHERLSTAVVDTYQRRDKTSRGYPRKKYETQAKPPKINEATPSQRELAKQVRDETYELGLAA